MIQIIKVLRFVFIIVLLFVLNACDLKAATLFSTDFEDNNLQLWSSSGGGATATISGELVKNGQNSIKIQHDKTSSYGFQTIIPNIEGGMFYNVVGFGATKDQNTAAYFIRLAWYESFDGTGSQLSSPNDSNTGNNLDGDWQTLEQTVQAPQNANSVKIRLVLNSKSAGLLASAYFDELAFQESIQTPSPTPEPTPSPSQKPTPTPAPLKTSTPIPIKTPTPQPTKTQVPTSTPKSIPTPLVLGIETSVPTKNSGQKEDKSFPMLAIVITSIGIIFVGIGGYFGYQKMKMDLGSNE